MTDGPEFAALWLFAAWVVLRLVFAWLDRRARLAAAPGLIAVALAHWRYAPGEWRAWCEAQRRDLWSRQLRPLAQWVAPALVLPFVLAPLVEAPAGLSPFQLGLLLATLGLAAAVVLLGPPARQFTRLTRFRGLDYEVFLGDRGVLEVWRDHGRIEALEEHLYAGAAVRRVEANGVTPAEIVFRVDRAQPYGVLHLEEHFLVPEGHLAEARALARRLTPPRESRRNAPPRRDA